MEETHRPWRTPSLVAIARSEPEESILTMCKADPVSSGPQNAFNGCFEPGGFAYCSAPAAS
jgi:hypothetical protein